MLKLCIPGIALLFLASCASTEPPSYAHEVAHDSKYLDSDASYRRSVERQYNDKKSSYRGK